MSEPTDPDIENMVIATVRDRLLAAIEGAGGRTRHRVRSRALLAAACAAALIAGAGAIAFAARDTHHGHSIRVSPINESTTTTPRTTASTEPPGPCEGAALRVSATGTAPDDGTTAWYLEIRNDAATTCVIPYPTAATAVDRSGSRVGLAGIDHLAGPGPEVQAHSTVRLLLSAPAVCSAAFPGERPPDSHYQSLEVTLAGVELRAPSLELVLCGQGVSAVRFETPPFPEDTRAIRLGDGRTIHLAHSPRWVGSGVGNGVTATPDGHVVAYEYDTATAHEIATIDTGTCSATACTETVIGTGHSPVYSAAGTLAFVALDRGTPIGPNEAMWKRAGSVTVRAPDGTSEVWAHDTGLQTIAWAGNTLLVEHDRPNADTEGFEELMVYRGPGSRTVLTEGLVAISPDGTRLLLAGGNGDHMLDLYDIASQRMVSSISIADYERALAPASELTGVDLSKWPGFEEPEPWPMSCCANFDGQSLWRDDLVLFPMTRHVDHRTDGNPDRFDIRPTLIRIAGDRIVPLRALRTGVTEEFDTAQRIPGPATDFVLKRSDKTPAIVFRCRIDGEQAHCNEDASAAWVFRLPTTATS